MTRAMAMATVLAMLCLQGARGLAEEWTSSNRTAAVPEEPKKETVPAASKTPKPVVKSKVIESAAEVELVNGTGDVDQEGALERTETRTNERKRTEDDGRDAGGSTFSTETSSEGNDLEPNLPREHARIYATRIRRTTSNRTSTKGRNDPKPWKRRLGR